MGAAMTNPPPPAPAPPPPPDPASPSEARTFEYQPQPGHDPGPQRGGAGVGMYAALIAMTLLAAGAGYLAYWLWSNERDTTAKLESSQAQVEELREARTEAAEKATSLEEARTLKEKQLEEANQKMQEVSTELAAAQSRLEELDEERAEISERLAEFKRMTEQFRRMIDSGQLEIVFRRGRMIVQLPAQVLFPSGSADLTDEGRAAIRDVARILRKMRGRHFIVGGHTDAVPVSNDDFGSNWELSAARAVNVTEALIKAGLKPQQLVAAGYAEHDPVASNRREDGRQKNRRIEIVLEPKLKPLPDLEGLEAAAAKR
jgi:chemotaxis protein MotB